ncbi:MAG: proton-conducting transporter membrane subunit [Gammaproteobacteria bacterium]|nr:proton-conducting transporter membrane subunit [Gammaproteobacteria bacterium]
MRDVSLSSPILVAGGFITVGLALKAAVFPLHTWLPNAYTYSPHAVTVFIAACSTKVSLYVLLRFEFIVFQPNLAEHAIQSAFILAARLCWRCMHRLRRSRCSRPTSSGCSAIPRRSDRLHAVLAASHPDHGWV